MTAIPILDQIHWENVTSADGKSSIRPLNEPLPVASNDQVLLGVPHLESVGTVRLPPANMVAQGYRYGPNDTLEGTLVNEGHEPIKSRLYRVIRLGYVPGTSRKFLEIVKIAEPV